MGKLIEKIVMTPGKKRGEIKAELNGELAAILALFDLLEKEAESSARAILGHWPFGYVHPYQDGNGRIASFVMNAMLASGGYPWTVIRITDRDAHLVALEKASTDMDIQPFAQFIAERVFWSLVVWFNHESPE